MALATHRTKVGLFLTFAVLAALLAFALVGGPGEVQAQGGGQPPPGPVVYSGTIMVGGSPAPDGLRVVTRLDNPVDGIYESLPRVTEGGRYVNLIAGPTSTLYNYRLISFHIIAVDGTITGHLGPAGLTASETDTFIPGPNYKDDFALTFPAIPPAPTPTPEPATPTPTPVDTPTPEPTVPPTPTNTPEPTATPEPTNTPTPEPTNTPEPTSTPEPTATPQPTPTPRVVVVTATPTVGPAATATPEPSGPGTCGQGSRPDAYVLLAGLGLIGLVWMRRRRDGSA